MNSNSGIRQLVFEIKINNSLDFNGDTHIISEYHNGLFFFRLWQSFQSQVKFKCQSVQQAVKYLNFLEIVSNELYS